MASSMTGSPCKTYLVISYSVEESGSVQLANNIFINHSHQVAISQIEFRKAIYLALEWHYSAAIELSHTAD